MIFGLHQDMRALVPGPLYHSAPNAYALRAGRVAELLVLMPKFDAEETLKLIEQYRIDTVLMVPTMFIRILRLPDDVRRKYDLSSLRFVVHSAAPCPIDVKRQMIDWLGPIIWEYYGGTETGSLTIVSSEEWLAKPGTVGRPLPYAHLQIQDDAGKVLPPGATGEIYSRVDLTAEFTYQNLPEKRAEVERDGYLTGGDVGFLDPDGFLFLCDRKRDMIISGGVNIYPAEIEAVLQSIPGVQDCAVFGVPDSDFGEAVMAAIEPRPGHSLKPDDVRSMLISRLASYKVPRHIEIHRTLPREDSGKIFKRKLRDPFWQNSGRQI
jgi:long-chain acyl-CoA synthetase